MYCKIWEPFWLFLRYLPKNRSIFEVLVWRFEALSLFGVLCWWFCHGKSWDGIWVLVVNVCFYAVTK